MPCCRVRNSRTRSGNGSAAKASGEKAHLDLTRPIHETGRLVRVRIGESICQTRPEYMIPSSPLSRGENPLQYSFYPMQAEEEMSAVQPSSRHVKPTGPAASQPNCYSASSASRDLFSAVRFHWIFIRTSLTPARSTSSNCEGKHISREVIRLIRGRGPTPSISPLNDKSYRLAFALKKAQ